MKKLLITGFEPFGGETVNPSWEAVKRLPDEAGDFELVKMQIPTLFGKAAEAVLKRAEEVSPDVIICVGQAGGRSGITPELVAINLRHAAIADNGGCMPQDEPVAAGGPAAYFASLPVRKMAAAVVNCGIPCQVSYSAGAYVCNDLLYTLLHHYEGTETKVGFIHVPYLPEQASKKTADKEKKDPAAMEGQGEEGCHLPSLPLDRIVTGLKAAVEAL